MKYVPDDPDAFPPRGRFLFLNLYKQQLGLRRLARLRPPDRVTARLGAGERYQLDGGALGRLPAR